MARTTRTRQQTSGSAPLPTAVDANETFEQAVTRLRELSASENEQVAVKAASDLAKLVRPHLRSQHEPERPPEQQEEDLIKSVPDYLWFVTQIVRERKVEPGYVRMQLAPILAALDVAEKEPKEQ
jgi:hypothetical protein